MAVYNVVVKEVWFHYVTVEAENEEYALEMAGDGDVIKDNGTEYSHSLEMEEWGIKETSI